MMQWALRQHPELWGGQESDFLIPLAEHLREVHAYGSKRGKLHWLSGQQVGEAEFFAYVGLGVNALYTQRAGGLRWVEQTPQYTLHMDDILALFPGALFIMMLRDGRDVVESLKNFVNPVEHTEASRLWAHFVTAGLDFADGPHRERVHVVRYQDAVENTSVTMEKIFAFLGLAPCEESVSWITDRNPINSSFADGDRRSRVGRWHGWSRKQRRAFHEQAGEVLIRAGFEPDDAWVWS